MNSQEKQHRLIEQYYKDTWAHILKEYDAAPHDVYYAFWYLRLHPIVCDRMGHSYLDKCLDISVEKVNPQTGEIDDDKSKNTRIEVWYECGPLERADDAPPDWFSEELEYSGPEKVLAVHDVELDGGAETFEKAIIQLASLVRKKYGDDRSRVYRRQETRDG